MNFSESFDREPTERPFGLPLCPGCQGGRRLFFISAAPSYGHACGLGRWDKVEVNTRVFAHGELLRVQFGFDRLTGFRRGALGTPLRKEASLCPCSPGACDGRDGHGSVRQGRRAIERITYQVLW